MLVKGPSLGLGIDTNISVIVVSLTTCEAHHNNDRNIGINFYSTMVKINQ